MITTVSADSTQRTCSKDRDLPLPDKSECLWGFVNACIIHYDGGSLGHRYVHPVQESLNECVEAVGCE